MTTKLRCVDDERTGKAVPAAYFDWTMPYLAAPGFAAARVRRLNWTDRRGQRLAGGEEPSDERCKQ